MLAIAGGRFLAGLISGGATLAVEVSEGAAPERVAIGTICATKAGNWGLGIYAQSADNRQCLLHFFAFYAQPSTLLSHTGSDFGEGSGDGA